MESYSGAASPELLIEEDSYMSQSLADLLAEEKVGHIAGLLVAVVAMDTVQLAAVVGVQLAAVVGTAYLVVGADTGYSAVVAGIVPADPDTFMTLVWVMQALNQAPQPRTTNIKHDPWMEGGVSSMVTEIHIVMLERILLVIWKQEVNGGLSGP